MTKSPYSCYMPYKLMSSVGFCVQMRKDMPVPSVQHVLRIVPAAVGTCVSTQRKRRTSAVFAQCHLNELHN